MFIIVFKLNPFLALPFSYNKVVLIIGAFCMFFFSKMKNVTIISKSVFLLLLLLIYGTIVSLNYNYEINHQIYRFFLFLFESLTVSFLILGAYISVFNKDLQYVLKVIFYCILVQSILIVLSFIFPFLFNVMDVIAPLEGTNFDEEISFRLYRGLSNKSGSGYSVVLSMGALLALYFYSMGQKKIYLISVTFFFLAAAINGRTGVVLIALFIAIHVLQHFKIKKALNSIVVAFFLLFLVQNVVSYFFSFSKRNQEIEIWYSEAFGFIESDQDEEVGFVSTFAEDHIFLPDTWSEILFGVGYDTDRYFIGRGSDSGMIKNVFSFGIMLTIILYLLLCYKLYKSGQGHGAHELYLSIGMIVLLLLSEYKEPFLVKTFMANLLFIVVIGRNWNTKHKLIF
jgi:hypothetical protein